MSSVDSTAGTPSSASPGSVKQTPAIALTSSAAAHDGKDKTNARPSSLPLAVAFLALILLVGTVVYFASLPDTKVAVSPQVLVAAPKIEPTEYAHAGSFISGEMENRLAVVDARKKKGKKNDNPLIGSEVFFDNGIIALEEAHPADAAKNFTHVINMMPMEVKQKAAWRAAGIIVNKRLYLALTYENRAYCYLKLKSYAPAIEDLSMAIRLRPDYAVNYSNRAKAYYLLGKRDLGDADMSAAAQLEHPDRLIE